MIVKTQEQINIFKEGGKILSGIIKSLVKEVRPGITTQFLADTTEKLLDEHGVSPSFLGYGGYPSVICLSVNEEAVHAVPSGRILNDGDVLKIDMGVIYGGYHTDSAVTVLVSGSNALVKTFKTEYAQKRKLMSVTRDALYAGIAQVKAGNHISDIGRAVQDVVEKNGLKVITELGGHGIGKTLHEEPFIPNFYDHSYGEVIKAGMVLALEPIVCIGTEQIKDGKDGFAYISADRSLVAHFEHTVIAQERGAPIIVTE